MVQRHAVQRQRIGPAIRRLRQERGLTLDQLAAEAGISASHLSRLERSQTLPSFTVLAKIAEVLGVGIDEFVRLERDVTLLDAELTHYLDVLAIEPPVRDEILALSIEARRVVASRLRQLGEAALTPVATQEAAGRALAERGAPEAWKVLNRLVRQAGMGGPAFMRAWRQVSETPEPRVLLVTDGSFFLLPLEADIVAAYHAVFRDEALDPSIVTWWESSEWLHDPAVARRWGARFVIKREVLVDALRTGRLGPGPELPREVIRQVLERLRDRLDTDEGFELAITDAELGPFNFLLARGQVGLIERLPERRTREVAPRAGLGLTGREMVAGFAGWVDQTWDALPPADKDRRGLVDWLTEQARPAGP